MTGQLSPALELAVALIAEGKSIAAYLCDDVPKDVADIPRCRLGVGVVGGNGGEVRVESPGTVVCIAYDVSGQLVTSTTTGMPCRVERGARCKVGPLAFGKDGKPHDT